MWMVYATVLRLTTTRRGRGFFVPSFGASAQLLAVLKWCHKEMTSTKKEPRERGRLIRCILRKFGRQTNSLTPIEKLKPKRQGK